MLASNNIYKPVSVILADPAHVRCNVETFQDTRTMVKVLGNYCKLDSASVVSAINRADVAAKKTNYLQNRKSNLTA